MGPLLRLLLLVAFAVLPALAIQGYNAWELREARRAELRESAARHAQDVADEVGRIVDGARRVLATLAQSRSVRDHDEAGCSAVVRRVVDELGGLGVLSATDAAGRIFCSSTPGAIGSQVGDRAYFRRAVETGAFMVGEYTVARVSGRRVVPLVFPVHDDSGRVDGVVQTDIDLAWLTDAFRDKQRGAGVLTLVDREGTLLLHLPNAEFIGTRAGPLSSGPDGDEQVAATTAVGDTGLAATAAIPAAPVLAAIDAATRRAIAMILAGFVLALGLGWLLGERFLTPVRRAEAERDRIFELSLDLLIETDAEGCFRRVSPAAYLILGLAPEELAGKRVADFIHPDDRDMALAARSRVLAGGEMHGLETRFRHKDGSWRWLSWTARSAPELGRIYGIGRDVTDRKRAAEELRKSEERLRAALVASGTGTFRWDIRTNALEWDEALDRLFGLEPGRTARSLEQFIALVHPDDRDGVVERCRRCAAESADFGMEFRVVWPDGSVHWLLDQGKTFRDAEGAAYMTGACVDVTSRKAAEQALRESDVRFRSLIEATAAVLWTTTADGAVTDMPEWRALTGQTREEVRGTGWTAALHPDDRARATRLWQRAVATSSLYDVEYRIRLSDGAYRWYNSRGVPVRNEDGSVREWVGTCTDIQEIVEARQMLANGRAELEALVAERTCELAAINERLLSEMAERARTEDALRHAQKMEAVGQLTGGVAHDFNNILTVISGNLELLDRKIAGDPSARRLATAALRSVDRAEKLTAQLLAFSRRQRLDSKPTDLNHVVSGMGDLVRRTVGDRIDIRWVLASRVPPAIADANQLETALLNLVINARDASPEGGEITIRTGVAEIDAEEAAALAETAPGRYATVAVSDTGTGMKPEIAARVFEPFFTTKEIGKGTGLGLAMVYGFVKQLKGHVRIDSEEGRGTTVTLYLPATEAQLERALPGDADGGAELPSGSGETILLVDDDAQVRQLGVEILSGLGYRVVEAADAAAALDLLSARGEIALMFADVAMPGRLNGVELAKSAREHWPALRILLTSGYPASVNPADEALAGVEFLQKPYRAEELARRIRRLLDDRPQSPSRRDRLGPVA